MNILQIILFGIATSLVALGLLFSIICVASDSWIAYDYGTIEGNQGLWKNCTTIAGDTTCIKFDGTVCKLASCCYFCLLTS